MTRKTRLLMLISCTLLLLASAVSAADGPPTVLYVYMDMGTESDVVRIDTEADTLTKIMTVNTADNWYSQWPFMEWNTLPVTPQSFLPAVEWNAFLRDLRTIPYAERNRVLNAMTTIDMDTSLEAFWEVRPDLLLLYRRFSQCMPQSPTWSGPFTDLCYGMTQFSLFDIHTLEERVIWQLPFHDKTGEYGWGCYTDFVYENFTPNEPVDEVLIHPTRDLIAVQWHSFGGLGCSNALFLIDYTLEIAEVTEFSGVNSIAWSPDGTQLAYMEECRRARFDPWWGVCTEAFGIIDLDVNQIAFFKEFEGDTDWIGWPSTDVLVFAQQVDGSYRQSLVWYNLSDHRQATTSLDNLHVITALSIHDDNTTTIISNGSNTQVFYPAIAFGKIPRRWVPLEQLLVWPVGRYSANGEYAYMGDGEGLLSLIDADLNIYPLNDFLEGYRQRYGAEAILLAALGAPRP